MDQSTSPSEQKALDHSVAELMISYHELNSSYIEELNEDPSPLEFMRYVASNRPFVIRGGSENWKACQKWSAAYLKQVMGGRKVTVASTLEGRADSVSVRRGQDIFVRPAYTQEPFEQVISYISGQELSESVHKELGHSSSPYPTIKYLQAQNDSLRTEYEELMHDIPASISFARIALQGQPDAINFWLGNSYSVTQLHKDNYENIYAQVLGEKHFVLLPPVDVAAVGEKFCSTADYEFVEAPTTGEMELSLRLNESNEKVPFPTWDPDKPHERATKFSDLAFGMRVTLNEGDVLYLPAQWYHQVSQSCNSAGVCCAVNYWYDMEFSGTFHPAMSFIRNVVDAVTPDNQSRLHDPGKSKPSS